MKFRYLFKASKLFIRNMGKKVETVLGPISPTDLGVTFCHEHLSMDYQEAAFTPPTPRDERKENSGFSLENLGWIRQVVIFRLPH